LAARDAGDIARSRYSSYATILSNALRAEGRRDDDQGRDGRTSGRRRPRQGRGKPDMS